MNFKYCFDGYILYENGNLLRLGRCDIDTKRLFKEKKISHTKTKNGYTIVNYRDNSNCKQNLLHRVMWEVFYGKIPNGYEIDHIDTVRTNNNLENLRLVTRKENCNNPKTKEHYVESNSKKAKYNNPLHSKQVIQMDLDNNIIAIYPSAEEASRCLNEKDGASIRCCCRGEQKHHKGFKWKYVNVS